LGQLKLLLLKGMIVPWKKKGLYCSPWQIKFFLLKDMIVLQVIPQNMIIPYEKKQLS
jgi:hypothetical protein